MIIKHYKKKLKRLAQLKEKGIKNELTGEANHHYTATGK